MVNELAHNSIYRFFEVPNYYLKQFEKFKSQIVISNSARLIKIAKCDFKGDR